MSDELLKQIAGELMQVYVGMGEEVPKLYLYSHRDNINIGVGERVIVTIRREHLPEEVKWNMDPLVRGFLPEEVKWDMAVSV